MANSMMKLDAMTAQIVTSIPVLMEIASKCPPSDLVGNIGSKLFEELVRYPGYLRSVVRSGAMSEVYNQNKWLHVFLSKELVSSEDVKAACKLAEELLIVKDPDYAYDYDMSEKRAFCFAFMYAISVSRSDTREFSRTIKTSVLKQLDDNMRRLTRYDGTSNLAEIKELILQACIDSSASFDTMETVIWMHDKKMLVKNDYVRLRSSLTENCARLIMDTSSDYTAPSTSMFVLEKFFKILTMVPDRQQCHSYGYSDSRNEIPITELNSDAVSAILSLPERAREMVVNAVPYSLIGSSDWLRIADVSISDANEKTFWKALNPKRNENSFNIADVLMMYMSQSHDISMSYGADWFVRLVRKSSISGHSLMKLIMKHKPSRAVVTKIMTSIKNAYMNPSENDHHYYDSEYNAKLFKKYMASIVQYMNTRGSEHDLWNSKITTDANFNDSDYALSVLDIVLLLNPVSRTIAAKTIAVISDIENARWSSIEKALDDHVVNCEWDGVYETVRYERCYSDDIPVEETHDCPESDDRHNALDALMQSGHRHLALYLVHHGWSRACNQADVTLMARFEIMNYASSSSSSSLTKPGKSYKDVVTGNYYDHAEECRESSQYMLSWLMEFEGWSATTCAKVAARVGLPLPDLLGSKRFGDLLRSDPASLMAAMSEACNSGHEEVFTTLRDIFMGHMKDMDMQTFGIVKDSMMGLY